MSEIVIGNNYHITQTNYLLWEEPHVLQWSQIFFNLQQGVKIVKTPTQPQLNST